MIKPALSQTFITQNRQQLTRLFTRMADCINAEFILGQNSFPIIIEINGDNSAGKTIPWDMIVAKLTKGHAMLDPEGTEHGINDDGTPHRDYETWVGPHRDTKEDIHIFCANVNDVDDNRRHLILGDRQEQNKLGDIILLNNTSTSIGLGASTPDIHIEVHFNETASTNSWARETRITIPESSRFYEQPEMRELLSFPAP